MGEWREVKLGDVLELKYGKDHKALSDGNIPVYGSGGIMRYADTFLYDKESILIPRKGTLNNIFYLNGEQPFWTVDTIFWSKINTELTFGKFLFYYLKIIDFANLNVGSAVPSLTTKVLNEVDISLPPLKEQKTIAQVLSSLDDKIDLLHRQNKTLEEMAQTLFRQWFIEEAKDEWEEILLGDYVTTTTGYSYKSTELNPSKNALITLKNFARDGSFRLDGFKEFTGTKFKDKQIVHNGDLVVSHTDITQEADIIGNPIIVSNIHNYDTLIITMDLMKVESNAEWLTKEYLYYLFKSSDFKFHCLCNSNGTTVLHMSRKTIPSYKVKIPSKDKILEFSNKAKNLLKKQNQNQQQIKTLENMRDTLLPKLMSRDVRVEL